MRQPAPNDERITQSRRISLRISLVEAKDVSSCRITMEGSKAEREIVEYPECRRSHCNSSRFIAGYDDMHGQRA
jgi:hypothetical protein